MMSLQGTAPGQRERPKKRWEDNIKVGTGQEFNSHTHRAAEDCQRKQKIVADVSSRAPTTLVVLGHNFRESQEMAHDLQVSRQCYKISRNVGNLIDHIFSATKHAFGVNPRDADHRDLKLAPDGARMMIALGLCLHKHSYYQYGIGRHLMY